MDEQIERLLVSLMVIIEQQGGEYRLDTQAFENMFEVRHHKGIQVQERGEEGIFLKLGDMTIRPDEAQNN
ncbi:hypothetical protein [Nitrospina watsonii]|uniref:Uncharacterized protein n=1 Tax=Nitrospina watsonii TaxID=1323948 RepID=A0ABM9HFK4_9BACT|nr:hypothetical protein [Nitrospina watsonii]CAI2718843.1 conserved protein of unknown function [Nitrospina watsonii]